MKDFIVIISFEVIVIVAFLILGFVSIKDFNDRRYKDEAVDKCWYTDVNHRGDMGYCKRVYYYGMEN